MTVDNLVIDNSIKSIDNINEVMADIKSALEQRINLANYPADERPVALSMSVVLRMCLLAGLADNTPRSWNEVQDLQIPLSGTPYSTTFFTKSRIGQLIGGRDHSTVIHSCSAIEQRLKVDKAFLSELSSIENSFKLKK